MAISHSPFTVLQPSGWDRVSVYLLVSTSRWQFSNCYCCFTFPGWKHYRSKVENQFEKCRRQIMTAEVFVQSRAIKQVAQKVLIHDDASDGNIFRVTDHLCGELTGHRWIPLTKASDAELWCFFDLRLNKRLRKQSRGSWFETPSSSLWRHCNARAPYHK